MAQANQMQKRWDKLKSEMLDRGYSEADYNAIASQINNMYDNYGLGDYYFQDKGNSEYTRTGEDPYNIGLNLLSKHETGSYDPSMKWNTSLLNYLDSVGTQPLTLEQLMASEGRGMNVKQDGKTGQWKTVIYGGDGPSDEDKRQIYWNQDPTTGKFSIDNTSNYVYSAPKKDNMMGDLMTLAAIAAAIYTGGASLGAWGGAEAGVLAAESAITEGYLAGTITAEAAGTALNTIYTNAGIIGGTAGGGATGMSWLDNVGNGIRDLFSGSGGATSYDSALNAIVDGGYSSEEMSSLIDALYQGQAYNTGAFDIASSGLLDTTQMAEILGATPTEISNMIAAGAPTSSSLMQLLGKLPTGIANVVKSLAGSGMSGQDLMSTIGKLYGNNQLANSTSDIIGDWLDEIKGASPFSAGEVNALGDRAIELGNRDYLAPELENLMGQYESRGAAADQFAGMMGDAYTDPLSNPFVASLMDSASNKALRAAGANGRLGGGGLEADMYNAMMSGAMPYLQQGTQHLGTLYQGQNAPINMVNALNQADQTAWGGAANIGRLAQGDQNAIAGFVQNVAAPAELITNPVGTGMSTLYGVNPMQPKTQNSFGSTVLNTAGNKLVDWGLGKITSLF